MKNKKEEEDVVSGTFTWVIDNFSKLKTDKHYSDVFTIGGFKWRILIRPKGSHDPESDVVDQLSIYLGVADASTLTPGWARYTHFSFTLVNQLDSSKSKIKQTQGIAKEFKEERREWGYKSFMPLCELYDCSAGYLVNDICIVEAKVDIPIKSQDHGPGVSATLKSSIKKEQKWLEASNVNSVQVPDSLVAPKTPCSELVPALQDTPGSGKAFIVNPTNDSPFEPSLGNNVYATLESTKKERKGQESSNMTSVQAADSSPAPKTPSFERKPPFLGPPSSEKVCNELTGELMEFMGLGKIEKAFVPLLEEVCSLHPSLIECLHKRNRKVSECAFTALGELLHFLKTTRVKDMTEDACVRLQSLWEDVEMFRFDLAWLEPHVHSALDKKKFLERARRVKRLREDVDILDSEKKRRSAALAVTEADLEVAKRDLAKEEEGFVETDMDRELGYGMASPYYRILC
ncbi:hypothetical protein PRUPE_2G054900 [Prunus persica]|nr:uncharacterized protein LOC18787676 isoform X2 [Prunus persica]ONI21241.1 hypothetical protein PRUPE_2G054900 [Prunus persica]